MDDLRAHCELIPPTVIAYLYLSFADAQRQRCTEFSRQSPFDPQCVQNFYDRHQQSRPTIEELSNTIQSVLNKLSDACVAIDALEDCRSKTEDGERRDVPGWLSEICCSKDSNCCIIVLSHKESDIHHSLLSSPV